MISKKTIALEVEVKDWQEAVNVSGRLLVESGTVEERYIQAMKDTVNAMGPYIVIAPGVALPHARPEDGVYEPCMSLITLKTPVNFGNKENDPVKLVVAFGTIDKKSHIDALKKLARIIGDQEKLEALKSATEVRVVEEIIAAEV
jgi:mannitol/fructose-specific phosphotransferase system IIA component (Ntr-type)